MRGKIKWDRPRDNMYSITEWEIDGCASALLILDLQLAYAHPDYGLGQRLAIAYPERCRYFYTRLAEIVLPNILKLQGFFRKHRLQVIYTRMGLQLPDGRDLASFSWRSAQTRAAQTLYPKDAPEHNLLPELDPRADELILDKHSLSPFNSTPLDQWLRNMEVENLAVCGVITDAAVEHTARSAGDRGYNAMVIDDACAALSPEEHEETFLHGSWFVRKTTTQLMEELAPLVNAS